MEKRFFFIIILFNLVLFLQIAQASNSFSVRTFDVDYDTGIVLISLNDGSLKIGLEHGKNWSDIPVPRSYFYPDYLKIDSISGKIYAYDFYNGQPNIYVSGLSNISWKKISLPTGIDYFFYKKPFEILKGKIYIISNKKIYIGSEYGFWSSSDIDYPEGDLAYIESFEVSNNGDIYIGFYSPYEIYRSTDNGVSWKTSNYGLNTHEQNCCTNAGYDQEVSCEDFYNSGKTCGNISSPAIIESVGFDIFTGSYVSGIYKYKGDYWERVTREPFPDNIGAFTLGIINSYQIYTQPAVRGFGDIPFYYPYRTLNGGATWEKIDKGISLHDDMDIRLLASHDGYVYALVHDGNLYWTHASKKSWSLVSTEVVPLTEQLPSIGPIVDLLLNNMGWSDDTNYRHAETVKQRAIVAAAMNGGNNRTSPQSIASGSNVVWNTDTAGGDGARMRLAIQDVYDYWITNSSPPLPLQSLSTDVQNSIRARLSATYPLAQQNEFIERIRLVFNGTVPTTDNQTLIYLGIRAQCKEFADRMVQAGGGITKTYGSAAVEKSKIRPGMYAFKNDNSHAAIIVAVCWDANGNPTKLRLAEANWGIGWANPAGQIPWERTVTITREVPITSYYVVATE